MTSLANALPPPEALSAFGLRRRRLLGLLQRHTFLLLGSWPRFIELLYWPTLNMLVWGFLNIYLGQQRSSAVAIGSVVLGGALMWEILLRSQFSLLVPFFEELWSRNLGHIFVSPLSPLEYVFGLVILSLLRTVIAMTPALILAEWCFGLWLPGLGLPFVAFYFNLALTGWWCGLLLVALILRYGLAAEWLAWMAAFALSPVVAVYYPVSILPAWLQPVSWALPPTYVFEGMRAILDHHEARLDYLLIALALNLAYTALAAVVFLRVFERTRRDAGLLQMSE